jgi:hypothetical protein
MVTLIEAAAACCAYTCAMLITPCAMSPVTSSIALPLRH